ncbi:MAG: hypothetical protein K2N28_05920 [Muribaculaceae bacterium]|nr:hypothetical protein [Muribaculaceae bacterium]
MNDSYTTPLEQAAQVATSRRRLTIGLPRSAQSAERRFPLTPEAVNILVEQGFTVKMERGAADVIHYTDNRYSRCGAAIVDRRSTLQCDLVIHLSPLSVADVNDMKRGAMLLTLFHSSAKLTRPLVDALMRHGIIAIALDLIKEPQGHALFADILSEIDGRASIAIASSLLADAIRGKGILLGGVAGIVPCEVMILGSGLAARAAAMSAIGLGAQVRMFDSDTYSLRSALAALGPGVAGSVPHPHVVDNALRSADIVIATTMSNAPAIDSDRVELMKRGVITFDISSTPGKVFPSMPTVDLAVARSCDNTLDGYRVCYINAGSAVPRTAAMALSNSLVTMLHDVVTCEGISNAVKLTPGLQGATLTFSGHAVNPEIARIAGCRPTDLALFLQLS